MTGYHHRFELNMAQKAALDDFAPELNRWREGLHASYFEPAAGRVTDQDVLETLTVIESFAKAFGIQLPPLEDPGR